MRENGNRGYIHRELISEQTDKDKLNSILACDITNEEYLYLRNVASRVLTDSAINMALLLSPVISAIAGDLTEIILNCSGGLVEEDKHTIVKKTENGEVVTFKEYLEQTLSLLTTREVSLRASSETKGVATLCASMI